MKATAGELVTCENGHPMYRMTRDVAPGEPPLNPELFEPVADAIPKLRRYTLAYHSERCSCGGTWVRAVPAKGGVEFHFHDGWRLVSLIEPIPFDLPPSLIALQDIIDFAEAEVRKMTGIDVIKGPS